MPINIMRFAYGQELRARTINAATSGAFRVTAIPGLMVSRRSFPELQRVGERASARRD